MLSFLVGIHDKVDELLLGFKICSVQLRTTARKEYAVERLK